MKPCLLMNAGRFAGRLATRLAWGRRLGASVAVSVVAGVLMLGSVGCASQAGSLTMTSRHQQGVSLKGQFTQGLYRFDDNNQLTLLLLDGEVDSFQQAVTVRMFWKPRAGRTPIDPTATNATIHYVIFTGADSQEAGVYSGAGFLFPEGKPGDDTLTVDLWQSTLRLADATDQFRDLLGPAHLKGHVRIRHDDVALEQALRQLNIKLRETFGYPRLVDAGELATPESALTLSAMN